VEVYTGSVKYAGTDANVYINIFGELGDTGQRWLKHPVSSNINKFEKKDLSLQINQHQQCSFSITIKYRTAQFD
jgi:hypothetical protein